MRSKQDQVLEQLHRPIAATARRDLPRAVGRAHQRLGTEGAPVPGFEYPNVIVHVDQPDEARVERWATVRRTMVALGEPMRFAANSR